MASCHRGEKKVDLLTLPVPAAPDPLLLVALMAVVLIFGWWLVAASGAQQLPRPSLSLHPSLGVEVGSNVTLQCHLPRPAAWVRLCQERNVTPCMVKFQVRDVAVFSLVITKWVHTGMYRCQYHASEAAQTSELSDPVEVMVTDHSFPPPVISLSTRGRVDAGTNVTVQCRNLYRGATFLHKDGRRAPVQRQDLSDGDMATFALFGVTPADSGTYRCSYHPKGYPFLSSPLGDGVTLEVTLTPVPPVGSKSRVWGSPVLSMVSGVTAPSPHGGGGGWGHMDTPTTRGLTIGSRGNLAVGVVRCCAAALVFGLGAFFVFDARNLWIWRDENPGGGGVKWV